MIRDARSVIDATVEFAPVNTESVRRALAEAIPDRPPAMTGMAESAGDRDASLTARPELPDTRAG